MTLQCTDWQVFPPITEDDKWRVGRTFDTVSDADRFSPDQSLCFGASWDLDSEWSSQEDAENRCNEIKGTNPKVGYEIID